MSFYRRSFGVNDFVALGVVSCLLIEFYRQKKNRYAVVRSLFVRLKRPKFVFYLFVEFVERVVFQDISTQ